MTPKSHLFGMIALAVIAALTIPGTALWLKGTEYENTWLYLSGLWIVIIIAFDAYSKRK